MILDFLMGLWKKLVQAIMAFLAYYYYHIAQPCKKNYHIQYLLIVVVDVVEYNVKKLL